MATRQSDIPSPTLSGLDRAAVLLMSLEDDTAAEVLKRMSGSDAQKLAIRMSRLGNISQPAVVEVLNDFEDELDQMGVVNVGTNDRIRTMLVKALGEDRADSLLGEIFESDQASGIDALNLLEAHVVAELIRDEHPQIIATIIVHLQRNQAADVLSCFETELRNDIVLRVATFSGIQPVALEELTSVLGGMLDGQTVRRSSLGGVHSAAEILNRLATSEEEAALENVRGYDADLAQRIVDEMFVFEDIVKLDDRSLQRLLTELDSGTLAVALKGADEALVDRFMSNMAGRAADLLREDMEMRGPVRKSKVEAERKRVLDVVRRLVENEEVTLGRDDDEYV